MNVSKLAELITLRIRADGPISFDSLEERATKKGIDLDLFYQAMEIVNRKKIIEIVGKNYREKIKKKTGFEHVTWMRDNYPPMIPGVNDASHPAFADTDFSYMFMTPDEAKEYRVMLKGGYGSRRKNSKGYTRSS